MCSVEVSWCHKTFLVASTRLPTDMLALATLHLTSAVRKRDDPQAGAGPATDCQWPDVTTSVTVACCWCSKYFIVAQDIVASNGYDQRSATRADWLTSASPVIADLYRVFAGSNYTAKSVHLCRFWCGSVIFVIGHPADLRGCDLFHPQNYQQIPVTDHTVCAVLTLAHLCQAHWFNFLLPFK